MVGVAGGGGIDPSGEPGKQSSVGHGMGVGMPGPESSCAAGNSLAGIGVLSRVPVCSLADWQPAAKAINVIIATKKDRFAPFSPHALRIGPHRQNVTRPSCQYLDASPSRAPSRYHATAVTADLTVCRRGNPPARQSRPTSTTGRGFRKRILEWRQSPEHLDRRLHLRQSTGIYCCMGLLFEAIIRTVSPPIRVRTRPSAVNPFSRSSQYGGCIEKPMRHWESCGAQGGCRTRRRYRRDCVRRRR